MSQLIYVETSIPSFYYETRTSVQLQARREWTHEWWELAHWRDALVISPVVIAELEETPDPAKRKQMLDLIADLPRLTYADQPIVPANRVYLEPSVFWRFGRGARRTNGRTCITGSGGPRAKR